MTLRLPALPGGRISVRIPADQPVGAEDQFALLTSNGGFFTGTNLASWVNLRSNRDIPGSSAEDLTVEIPHLASGLYALVWTSGNLFDLAAQGCAGAFSAADWQHLTPGGELLMVTPKLPPG